jgi:hypothetical protein
MISAWFLVVLLPLTFMFGFCVCALFSVNKEDDNANV